jgi:hypothetical protein
MDLQMMRTSNRLAHSYLQYAALFRLKLYLTRFQWLQRGDAAKFLAEHGHLLTTNNRMNLVSSISLRRKLLANPENVRSGEMLSRVSNIFIRTDLNWYMAT